MRSISISAPLRPSITTQEACLYRAFSHSTSHVMPWPVGLISITLMRPLPVVGKIAPANTTLAPSALNLTPYAVFPSGFGSSDLQAVHAFSSIALSACSLIGLAQKPRRSRANPAGLSVSYSFCVNSSVKRVPKAGLQSAHSCLSLRSMPSRLSPAMPHSCQLLCVMRPSPASLMQVWRSLLNTSPLQPI